MRKMIAYILTQFDKALRRKSAYVYFIGIFVLCIIANIAVVAFRTVYGTNEGTYAYNIMEYAAWSFIVAYLSCILIANIVFGRKYPGKKKKDKKAKDLSPAKIYLGKLISAVMVAFVFLVITFVVLVATTALFHISDDRTLDSEAIRVFCKKLFLAMPLFLAGISMGMMFLFCFEDKKKAFVGFYIVTLAIPRLIILLAGSTFGIGFFKLLRKYTISQCFTLIPYPSSPDRNIPLMIALGFIYSVLSTVIGIIVYNKKVTKEVHND